jgi:hypothetical protein
MIVVIQCASRKRADAGRLRSENGRPVVFVTDPLAPAADAGLEYARPDDPASTGMSWRQTLLEYNREGTGNPLGLCPAWRLYENETYGRLVDHLGPDKLYILSAGWGLIRADFPTPYCDITFSTQADRWKRRRKSDRYEDRAVVMLPLLPGPVIDADDAQDVRREWRCGRPFQTAQNGVITDPHA